MVCVLYVAAHAGISSSLYTYNVGTDATLDGVDDSSTLVGNLTTEYILYGNNYTDLYVRMNKKLITNL